jgi:membrane protease YdiL (CAAX protease family)
VAPAESDADPQVLPPAAGVGGMPHGSLPILVSSMLFAWAHLGHGTDPFPLFVLSLFLGFVYQRTHCILPSIVLHAMFNLLSMLMFWLTMFNK